MPNQNIVPSPFKSPEIPQLKKKSNPKKVQASPVQMNVTFGESDVSFTEEEDDEDKDPDWQRTPLFRRLQTIRVKDFLQISSCSI